MAGSRFSMLRLNNRPIRKSDELTSASIKLDYRSKTPLNGLNAIGIGLILYGFASVWSLPLSTHTRPEQFITKC